MPVCCEQWRNGNVAFAPRGVVEVTLDPGEMVTADAGAPRSGGENSQFLEMRLRPMKLPCMVRV